MRLEQLNMLTKGPEETRKIVGAGQGIKLRLLSIDRKKKKKKRYNNKQ